MEKRKASSILQVPELFADDQFHFTWPTDVRYSKVIYEILL